MDANTNQRFVELLNSNGYNPSTLAKKIGVSYTSIRNLYVGLRDIRNVSADILLKIAKEFGVTLEYLLDVPEQDQIICKTVAEKRAFLYMKALNDFGQRRALQYMQDLILTGVYPPDAEDRQDEIFQRKLELLDSLESPDVFSGNAPS